MLSSLLQQNESLDDMGIEPPQTIALVDGPAATASPWIDRRPGVAARRRLESVRGRAPL
jgi:hypothetical protein